MGKLVDLTGQKFGRLKVLERAPGQGRNAAWVCICDCGNRCTVLACNLRAGKTKSCGCFGLECKAENNRIHGGSHRSRLYRIWKAMKWRCNPKSPDYKHYGARGITVCKEWEHSFEAFRDWAMAHGYAENLTIDRINNDKGYSPDNCRWITQGKQNLNKRNNHTVTYQGRTQTLSQWAKEFGLNSSTLHRRLKEGWPVEKALTTPPEKS